MSIGPLSFPHANEPPNFNRKASLCKLNNPRGCQYLKNAYIAFIMLPHSQNLLMAIYLLINQPDVFEGLHSMAPNNCGRTVESKEKMGGKVTDPWWPGTGGVHGPSGPSGLNCSSFVQTQLRCSHRNRGPAPLFRQGG